jgi:hypothetical protein
MPFLRVHFRMIARLMAEAAFDFFLALRTYAECIVADTEVIFW